MHKPEHKRLLTRLLDLDEVPDDLDEFASWIAAKEHLQFLTENARDDEFIVYASGPYSYVNTILVPRTRVEPPDVEDLLRWNGCNPYTVRSSYVSRGGRSGTQIEDGLWSSGTRSLEGAKLLVYIRSFEGWRGSENTYFEALQEFIHLQGLYWVDEQSAYCRLDELGDLEAVLSVTRRAPTSEATMVSVDRETFDEYLSIANLAAVRVFEFMLLRRDTLPAWGSGDEGEYTDKQGIWYRQESLPSHSGCTRGIQIIQPADNYAPRQVGYFPRSDSSKKEHVKFLIQDWRHNCLSHVTTDPAETTNYFDANANDLPFDVSPAFFRPEVLSKYKADKDKYVIETRRLSCRGAWELKTYDVNDAGQVHTYICYLRDLPYGEQLHWAQFNEPPKAPISRRAITTDIEGKFTDIIDPIDRLRTLLTRWDERGVSWWRMPDSEAAQRVCTPLTASRDEWAEAFLDLNKLVNEGFVVKAIRAELTVRGVNFENGERSLKLLERLWAADDPVEHGALENLKSIAHIRSKTKGHAGTADAKALASAAIREHGSFRAHFDAVCTNAIAELELVERLFLAGKSL